MNQKTRIAAAQFSMSDSMEANYQKALHYIREAAVKGARLVCFPEGQLSQYVPQYEGLDTDGFAVELTHPFVKGLCAACRENHILAALGLCLKLDEHVYATVALISEDGSILGIEKKKHIVRAKHFYEKDYFTAGNDGFQVIDTSIGKIGLIVCYDRHFPESYRACVRKGAELILVPVANEKLEPTEIFRWEIRIAAFQNSVNLIMCNRIGLEGNMDFCGETLMAAPDGSLLALADDTEQLLFADMDLAGTAEIRRQRQYLPLLRPDVFLL
ncbi:MAG: carbon-nitrogen hydrolase family protein [Lachnospiraceae bacterium]|jgi:predicted amidohydrolase|nr:carbon-nitrogen hydrolase family protein [Lachnospiraceae bacterium]